MFLNQLKANYIFSNSVVEHLVKPNDLKIHSFDSYLRKVLFHQ